MAEDFFASAFIRLKPDPTGFLIALREEVKAAALKVPAKVRLLPDPVGFRTALRKEIRAAETGLFAKVPLIFEPVPGEVARVRTLLQKELAVRPLVIPVEAVATKASTAVAAAPAVAETTAVVESQAALTAKPISIPVVPTGIAEFRALLETELAAKPIPVPVVPVVAPAAGAIAGAATPLERQTAAEGQQTVVEGQLIRGKRTLLTAQTLYTRAVEQYNVVLGQELTATEQVAGLERVRQTVTQALKRSQVELGAAVTGATDADRARIGVLQAEITKLQELIVAQKEAAVSAVRTGGTLVPSGAVPSVGAVGGVAEQTAAEARLSEAEAARSRIQAELTSSQGLFSAAMAETAGTTERLVGLQEAFGVANKSVATTSRDAAAATLAQKTELEQLLASEGIEIARLKEQIALQTRLDEVRARTTASLSSVAAQGAALQSRTQAALQRAVPGGVPEARITSTAAIKQAALAQEGLNAAIASGNPPLIRAQIALAAYTKELESAAIAEVAEARAAGSSARAHAQFGRAIFASGAGLAGLRGNVLAASGPFIAGTIAAVTFFKSLKAFADLQVQLNVFQASTKATAEQMKSVSDEAIRLGADITLPAISAADAAKALTDLAKAGLGVAKSQEAARGVLQLSTAANISAADSANIVASALNSFGLRGREATKVADLLAAASTKSQSSIADLGGALNQAAATSRLAGVSIDDTVALLNLLAKNGIQGASAGTVLRVALLRLVAPTSKARDEIKKLGIQIRDAQGNVRPDVFAQFAKATENLGKAQQAAVANIVFGTRGIRAQAILGREGAAGLDLMRRAVERQGAAQALASARTKGLAGDIENLKNQADTAGIEIGRALDPAASAFIKVGANIASGLGAIGKAVGDTEDFLKQHPLKVSIIGPSGFDITNLQARLREVENRAVPGVAEGFFSGILNRTQQVLSGRTGASSLTPRPEDIAALQEFGKQLAAVKLSVLELRQIFAGATDPIGKTLRDGIIKPLEAIQLSATLTGRAFLKGFAPTQPGLEKTVRAIDLLEKALGRLPTIRELKILLDTKNPQQALRDIVFAAIAAGTSSGQGYSDKFDKTGTDGLHRGRSDFKAIFDGISKDAADAGVTAGKNITDGILAALKGLRGRLSGVQAQADITQIAAGGVALTPQQQLAQTQAEIAQQERIVAEDVKLVARNKKRVGTLRADRHALAALFAQEAQERAQIASDANQAAQNAKSKAQAATQSFLTGIDIQNQQLQNRIAAASAAGDVRREIALTELLARRLKEEEIQVRKRVKDAQEAARTIAGLEQQRIAALASIAQLQKQAADARKQAEATRRQNALERANLLVQIADAQGNLKLEERRLRFEIALITKQIQSGKIKGNALLQLELTRAQEQARLKDLLKQTNDTSAQQKKLFQAQEFAFLQAQQGFAANLLGNLIPFSATGGLVGGTTPGPGGVATITPVQPIPADVGQSAAFAAAHAAHRGVSDFLNRQTQAAEAGRQGPTRVGQTQELQLLGQILATLLHIHDRTKHPEAHQRRIENRGVNDFTTTVLH